MFEKYLDLLNKAYKRYMDTRRLTGYKLPTGWDERIDSRIIIYLKGNCRLVLDDMWIFTLYNDEDFQMWRFEDHQSEIFIYLYGLDKKYNLPKFFNCN